MSQIKFLADVNVEKAVVDSLVAQGYDVIWVADHDRGMLDEHLLELARQQGRILLTNDKDSVSSSFYRGT